MTRRERSVPASAECLEGRRGPWAPGEKTHKDAKTRTGSGRSSPAAVPVPGGTGRTARDARRSARRAPSTGGGPGAQGGPESGPETPKTPEPNRMRGVSTDLGSGEDVEAVGEGSGGRSVLPLRSRPLGARGRHGGTLESPDPRGTPAGSPEEQTGALGGPPPVAPCRTPERRLGRLQNAECRR